ncbi:hypothetical protein [Streptomyces sp. URMC 123]|uniref:hypothetical protein n=1 Tax=Streptomyces sp. URMC 123 TaxID=3423403 RepID=UPI003F1DB5FF
MRSHLRDLLGLVAFVLIAGGAAGLLHEWLGWFHLFGFLRFLALDGYEIYSYLVLIALGFGLGAAGDAVRRDR